MSKPTRLLSSHPLNRFEQQFDILLARQAVIAVGHHGQADICVQKRNEIERDIANYTLIEHDGVIFGCAALYPYPEARTGEMLALTVSPQSQSQGDGERILKRIEQRARAAGLDSIFVLTTRTMHWFIKRGFAVVDPGWLPEARQRKYNWDRRSQVLVKKLN